MDQVEPGEATPIEAVEPSPLPESGLSVTPAIGSGPPSRPADFSDPIATAASELLANASAWSLESALGPEDLTIRLRTEVKNRQGEVVGEAGFNLTNVLGFRDAPKCNLLAFEIAFRAGFVVPLVGRTVGWGFPSSEMIANDARDYEIVDRWAEVRRRPEARGVNMDRELGHAFIVVARATVFGQPGHIAIIDWIEELALNRQGEIRMVSLMGWEANTREGARYRRIVFASIEAVPTSRFDGIYIIELRQAEPGNEIAMIGDGPRNPTHVLNLEGAEVTVDDERM